MRGCGGIQHPAIVSQRAAIPFLFEFARPPLSRSLVWHPHHTTFPSPSLRPKNCLASQEYMAHSSGSNLIHFCLPRDPKLWRRQISSMQCSN